jgi:uncharacterized membrane protein (UPF0127 family)
MAQARLLLILTAAILFGCEPPAAPTTETVVLDGNTFHLEPADTDATRERGLMERTAIDDDGGMLFIFPDVAQRGFWMGHCLIDIDIIFLDSHGRVTATHRMKAQPPQRPDESDSAYRARMPTYPSRMPAQFVIELSPGWLDRLSVRVDDKVSLDLPRLKARARTTD